MLGLTGPRLPVSVPLADLRVQLQDSQTVTLAGWFPWLTVARFLLSLLDIKIHVHGYHDIKSFPPHKCFRASDCGLFPPSRSGALRDDTVLKALVDEVSMTSRVWRGSENPFSPSLPWFLFTPSLPPHLPSHSTSLGYLLCLSTDSG